MKKIRWILLLCVGLASCSKDYEVYSGSTSSSQKEFLKPEIKVLANGTLEYRIRTTVRFDYACTYVLNRDSSWLETYIKTDDNYYVVIRDYNDGKTRPKLLTCPMTTVLERYDPAKFPAELYHLNRSEAFYLNRKGTNLKVLIADPVVDAN